jgi:hypothetical protein
MQGGKNKSLPWVWPFHCAATSSPISFPPSGHTKDGSQALRLLEVRFAAMETHRNSEFGPHFLFPARLRNEHGRPALGLIKLKLLLRTVDKRTDVQQRLIGSA